MSPSAGERLGQAEQLLLLDPKRLFLAFRTAPACPRACPRGLREVPQPPTLPLTRRFMNKPGSHRLGLSTLPLYLLPVALTAGDDVSDTCALPTRLRMRRARYKSIR